MRRIAVFALASLIALPVAAAEVEIVPPAYRAAGCLDAASCRIGAALIGAGPAPRARLTEQRHAEVHGLGVALTDTQADRDRELQGPILEQRLPGETVTVAFDRPHRIARIVIGHLYNPAMPGDPPETAIVEGFAAGASLGTIRLRSVSEAAGGFAVSGTAPVGRVARLDVRAGQYVLFDPFGRPLDRLVFSAEAVESGDTADYSIVAIGADAAR